MTKLEWDAVGERTFETGVEKGVFYPIGGAGVPWNGLVSVEEISSGAELQSYYFDGDKYVDHISSEDYQANVTAYTYPDEFEECDGLLEIQPGLFATRQRRKPFNLCYRTIVGNDVDGYEHGYKLHLVYNVTASPSPRGYQSLGADPSAINFVWQVNAVPVPSVTNKPTAYLVVDSTRIDSGILLGLENVLYGTDTEDPAFPTQSEVSALLAGSYITEFITEPL